MNPAEREVKLERGEQRGRVTEKIILERKETCDQIDSVICFMYDKFSFKCFSAVFLCFPGPG